MSDMRVSAVICECNPLHEGHRYIFSEARRVPGADRCIALMSGDFVQRGEPAVEDKLLRAEELLRSGMDLVLELPCCIASGSAGIFAGGAASLVSRLGVVTDLCFGSETGDLPLLERGSRVLMEETGQFQSVLRARLKEGATYAAARAAALEDSGVLIPEGCPNDLLGLEYLLQLRRDDSSVIPHAVRRISSESAGSIRAARKLRGEGVFPDDLSEALYAAIVQSKLRGEPLTRFRDVSPELAARIGQELPRFRSWSSFCELIKTKNVSYTTVSRALLHILLDITAEETRHMLQGVPGTGFIRVLGVRREAKDLLGQIASVGSVPLIVRPGSDADRLDPVTAGIFAKDLFRSALYRKTAFPDRDDVPEEARPLLTV